jgi:hypothetical protein
MQTSNATKKVSAAFLFQTSADETVWLVGPYKYLTNLPLICDMKNYCEIFYQRTESALDYATQTFRQQILDDKKAAEFLFKAKPATKILRPLA